MYSRVASLQALLAVTGGSAACLPSGPGDIYSTTFNLLSKNPLIKWDGHTASFSQLRHVLPANPLNHATNP